MSNSKIYHEGDAKAYNELSISTKAKWSYVSDYFSNNNHTKPTLTLNINAWSLDDARNHVYHEFTTGCLQPKSAATYLYLVSQTFRCTLSEDWTSFQVDIGKQGDVLSPHDLCVFTAQSANSDSVNSGTAQTSDIDGWLIIAVCGHYRLATISTSGSYIADTTDTIMTLMGEAGYVGTIAPRRAPAFGSNKTFAALIAAFDMYWNKFPEHGYSTGKVGTLVSRYQDASILGSLALFSKTIGLTPTEVVQWIFNKSVGEDASIIVKSPDDMTDQYSYLPYLHGLALTTRSPYSVSTCPNLHFWIHFVGCFMNSPRSVNARMVEGANISEIPRSAALMAYALKEASNMAPRFASASDIFARARDALDRTTASQGNSEPSNRNPLEWFQWFMGESFRYSTAMLAYMLACQQKPNNTRTGTIGDAFVNYTF